MAIICSYIASPTHWRAYLHHCTQLSVSLYTTKPQCSHTACVSQVNSSISLPHCGQTFSKISGVRGFP